MVFSGRADRRRERNYRMKYAALGERSERQTRPGSAARCRGGPLPCAERPAQRRGGQLALVGGRPRLAHGYASIKSGRSMRLLSPRRAMRRTSSRGRRSRVSCLSGRYSNASAFEIRPRCKLGGCRLGYRCVLRHAGSVAVDLGYSEPTIAALVGHKGRSVTSRYALLPCGTAGRIRWLPIARSS
jgi:hypothetical protein